MAKNELVTLFRRQALRYYRSWCSGKRDIRLGLLPELERCTLSDLIELINNVLKEIPLEVEYEALYCFSALEYVFPALLDAARASSNLECVNIAHLFRYAKIFLNVGAYQECIDCCNACIRARCVNYFPPKLFVEISFAESKAYRNMGEYQKALAQLLKTLEYVDKKAETGFLKGSTLLRIGKVYSEYLMMIGVSICFLQEAKEQLAKWQNSEDLLVREYVRKEYAICLDEMGQYWREKEKPDKAISFFQKARKLNQAIGRKSGEFRNQAHIISVEFRKILDIPIGQRHLGNQIRTLQCIIRSLMDDQENQKGVGVRLLQLAQLQKISGDLEGAITTLEESKRIALLYQDDKTWIKAKIAELQYHIYQGEVDRLDLMKALDLARERKYFDFEITLNTLAIEAADHEYMHSADMLPCLRRNRALYLRLSRVAQGAIQEITNHETCNVFSYLSEKTNIDLLKNVVSDYDWFVQKMNDIIDRLLNITEIRSQQLTAAVITEAKTSLATGVLHDLKHILTTEDGATTYLDAVVSALDQWKEQIPQEEREQLSHKICMVNENLKQKIYPRILEATRMPHNFNEEINVRNVLSDLSRQKPEEYQDLQVAVHVECAEDLILEYNYSIFWNLIKELLRNAIDYQNKCQVMVIGYFLTAQENYGQISFSVFTEFQEENDALDAYQSIDNQLAPKKNTSIEDGYGITLLRNFVHTKTAGAAVPKAKHAGRKAGIVFEVPNK